MDLFLFLCFVVLRLVETRSTRCSKVKSRAQYLYLFMYILFKNNCRVISHSNRKIMLFIQELKYWPLSARILISMNAWVLVQMCSMYVHSLNFPEYVPT